MTGPDAASAETLEALYQRIYDDQQFRQLQRRRSRLSWSLAAIVFLSFYSYISIVGFSPGLLAVPVGPDTVITWGIPVAIGLIALGVALTGYYVWQANRRFDPELAAIVERVRSTAQNDLP